MTVLIDPRKTSHALGLGVYGYSVDTPDGLYIPVVQAQREGHGDVGRWLDGLPTDRRIVFASVFSPRLAGMLARRGWTPVTEHDPRTGEDVPCWERGREPFVTVPLSLLRCSECGDLLDAYGSCSVHGLLDIEGDDDA